MVDASTTGLDAGELRPAARGAAGRRPRLLIVEDNPVNRLMLGVVADQAGLEHVAVGCIEEALLRFSREAFDAVLVDVEMDGGAGLVLARPIVAMSGPDAPAILALGGSVEADVLAAAGFSGMVESPVDSARLVKALIDALERDLGLMPLDG
jgi:CheY-like chemotaxis protein